MTTFSAPPVPTTIDGAPMHTVDDRLNRNARALIASDPEFGAVNE